jgi:hypothetical protein
MIPKYLTFKNQNIPDQVPIILDYALKYFKLCFKIFHQKLGIKKKNAYSVPPLRGTLLLFKYYQYV